MEMNIIRNSSYRTFHVCLVRKCAKSGGTREIKVMEMKYCVEVDGRNSSSLLIWAFRRKKVYLVW